MLCLQVFCKYHLRLPFLKPTLITYRLFTFNIHLWRQTKTWSCRIVAIINDVNQFGVETAALYLTVFELKRKYVVFY